MKPGPGENTCLGTLMGAAGSQQGLSSAAANFDFSKF